MSTHRSAIIEFLDGWSKDVALHLAKCAMYQDSLGRYNHWVHELASWIVDGANMTCKPNDRKLKPNEYEDTIFKYFGTAVSDAERNLRELQRYNKKYGSESYPYVEIDDAMVNKMFDASQALMENIIPLMASKNKFKMRDMETYIHDAIDPYII